MMRERQAEKGEEARARIDGAGEEPEAAEEEKDDRADEDLLRDRRRERAEERREDDVVDEVRVRLHIDRVRARDGVVVTQHELAHDEGVVEVRRTTGGGEERSAPAARDLHQREEKQEPGDPGLDFHEGNYGTRKRSVATERGRGGSTCRRGDTAGRRARSGRRA